MKQISFAKSLRTAALALLCCLMFAPVQAQTLDEILAESNVVQITGKRSGKVMYHDGGDRVAIKTKATDLTNKDNWDQLWVLLPTAYEGRYDFRNVKTGKYLCHGGSASGNSDFYVDAHNGYFAICQEDTYPEGGKYINEKDGTGLTTYNLDDGSLWSFTAVPGVTAEMVKNYRDEAGGFSALEDGKIYEIVNFAYGHILTENFTSNNYVGQAQFNAGSQYFRVSSKGSGQWSFQNVASKRYVPATPGTSAAYTPTTSEVAHPVQVSGSWDNYYGIGRNGNNQGWHEASSQGNTLVSWYINTYASYWQFREVTLTAEEIAAFEADYDKVKDYAGGVDGHYATMQLFFEDAACTQLKAEFQAKTDDEMRIAMMSLPEMIQEEILKIKNNSWANAYEKGFRMAEYGAFSAAGRGAEKMKLSNQLCLINNPTGIVGDGGEYVFIVVGDDIPEGASLKATTSSRYTHWAQQSMTLKKGLNFFLIENNDSHVFIEYISPQDAVIAEVPKINIHVIGGTLEGYFDYNKHTDADWVAMQEAGLFQKETMNILGTYSQLLVQTAGIKQYNPEKIHPLIGEFEWYCYTELEIMGLTALPDSLKHLPDADKAHEDLFPRVYNNRMLCVSDENSGSMYAGGNKICLGDAYMNSTYNYENIKNRDGCTWAPAHEYGHQMQSAIHVAASTEVSNNFFSNVMLYRGGTTTSRGWNLQNMQRQWAAGTHNWPNICVGDIWLATQMYYQLYLYYHAAGNDELFYQKLFRLLREDPMKNLAGACQAQNDYLHFAKKCCLAANQDLSEFFEFWGFFVPVRNVTMASYSTWTMTALKKQIDIVKDFMAEFEVKGNPAMIFIDDRVVESYCEDGTPKAAFGGEYPVEWCTTKASGAQYSKFKDITLLSDSVQVRTSRFNPSSTKWSFKGVNTSNLSGFRLLDANGNLIYAMAPKGYQLTVADIPEAIQPLVDRVELCYCNGMKIVALSTTSGIEDITTAINNVIQGTADYYDLTGRKVCSPVKGQIYIVNGTKIIF